MDDRPFNHRFFDNSGASYRQNPCISQIRPAKDMVLPLASPFVAILVYFASRFCCFVVLLSLEVRV